ncbi:MAG: TlpA disulfide reductase family protein [Bacteroidota bacterium]|nr:TlpA disulfide reductase family protein [Bacteroidota bacterium]MDP4249267.1 TlpA disulfide reductase family protein [Bacteroidota bacterium]
MKRFLILAGGLMGLANAQGIKPEGFIIHGQVKDVAEKSAVFITDANKPADTLAKSSVKSGVFVLKGQVTEPNLYELNFGSAAKKAVLFIGNENVKVEGSVKNLSKLKVTGSSSHDDFMSFQQTFNPYFHQLNALSKLANSPEGVSKRDSIGDAYNAVAGIIENKIDSFIGQKKSSYVSPFVLVVTNQLADDPLLLERRYLSLSSAVQESMYGKYVKEQIATGKIGAVGTEAIDFTQNDTAGNPVSLSSFKGKYVLVDFWASWCQPCRMENPNVLAAFGKFKAKNFTVLGVSLDRAREPWIKAIHDDRLEWAQVSDLKFWNNEAAMKYRIQQIPQNFLVDPNGKIIAKNLRGPELDARLCSLLGCN